MANTNASQNVFIAWGSTGAGDTLTCASIDTSILTGVQIDAPGITLEDAIITITTVGNGVVIPEVPAGAGESTRVGIGFSMKKAVLSNVVAGTYNVRFGQ